MRRYGIAALAAGFLSAGAPTLSAAPLDKPIVAVFTLRDGTAALTPDQREQLSDYLAVKLVEAGAFLVVPRTQLKALLDEQKRESYRECYDEACQIEVGKELAASHSLVTQILKVGTICAVTGTLYDLRLQATAFAASHKGGCTPEALAESMEQLSAALTNGLGRASPQAAKPPPPAPPGPTTSTSSAAAQTFYQLRVRAAPGGSVLYLNGREQRRASLKASLPKGRHEITVEKPGYLSQTMQVDLTRDRRLQVELSMDPAFRRRRTEWFGMAVGAYSNLGGTHGGLWSARLFTIRWGGPFWTLAEGTLGASSGEQRETCSVAESPDGDGVCTTGTAGFIAALQTVFGWSFSLDTESRHVLEVLAGFGAFGYSAGAEAAGPVAVSPGLRYVYHGRHGFSIGFGARTFISLIGRDCPSFGQDPVDPVSEQLSCDRGRQALFVFDVPFGWSY